MKQTIQATLLLTLILLAGHGLPAADTRLSGGTAGDSALVAGKAVDLAAAQQAGQPSITIPDPLFTFDPVVDGAEVVHDFRIFNRGDGELAIENVRTG